MAHYDYYERKSREGAMKAIIVSAISSVVVVLAAIVAKILGS